ncbi:MAG: hypothetical protein ACE5JO_06810, partial [Candidatus Binatia bacterium]
MSMNLLVIFFDGLGDRPVPELGRKTPLEAAATPNIDRLAREGINGLLHAKSPGYPLGSPLALHLLFGYSEDSFPDRGPLLARARNVHVAEGEVVLAARFASTVKEDRRLRLIQRFVCGREEACQTLAEAVAKTEIDGLRFRYVYCGRGDGLLLISGGASHEVTDTDPFALNQPILRAHARAEARDPELATHTARALNEWGVWAHRVLSEHPASNGAGYLPPINSVIAKWAGLKPSLEPFVEKWGMSPGSLPDEEVVNGLMLEMGFHLIQISNTDPENDLRERLIQAQNLVQDGYEFIHVHTKYPDPISHDNEPERARDAIEALDRAMGWYWQ